MRLRGATIRLIQPAEAPRLQLVQLHARLLDNAPAVRADVVARLVASEHVGHGGRSGEGLQHIARELVREINVEAAQPPGEEQRHIKHRLALRGSAPRKEKGHGARARTARTILAAAMGALLPRTRSAGAEAPRALRRQQRGHPSRPARLHRPGTPRGGFAKNIVRAAGSSQENRGTPPPRDGEKTLRRWGALAPQRKTRRFTDDREFGVATAARRHGTERSRPTHGNARPTLQRRLSHPQPTRWR